jgi:primosomal protein N' (replication factor Y)
VVGADASFAAVQTLIRWDPVGGAIREFTERRELRFPPVSRMAALTGSAEATTDLLTLAQLPEQTEVIGPVPVGQDEQRVLLRVERKDGAALAASLKAAASLRSARKAAEPVRIALDPRELI